MSPATTARFPHTKANIKTNTHKSQPETYQQQITQVFKHVQSHVFANNVPKRMKHTFRMMTAKWPPEFPGVFPGTPNQIQYMLWLPFMFNGLMRFSTRN